MRCGVGTPTLGRRRTVSTRALAFAPGEKWQYGNEVSTPDLQKDLFPDLIRDFAGTLGVWGRQTSVALLERRDEEGNRVYRYRVVFEKASVVFRLVLNPAGKIAGIGMAR
jgi:hypothetical protein